jgi:MFS family permease
LKYQELFGQYPIIKQISILQFIAYMGAWFSNVAIYSMLVDFNASAFTISLVTAMYFLPAVILSPFSGTFVDRVDPKKLMMILLFSELAMTISFLTIKSIDDVPMLLLFLFIRTSSASMFFTSEMTLMPKLIKGEALVKANELHSIIWSFTFTAGMALGGVVVHSFGIKSAFIIDSSMFVISILILSKIDFDIEIKKVTQTIFSSIKDGYDYIIAHKEIIKLIFLHGSVGLTAFDTLVTLLANYHYKYIIAVPLAIGLSNATRALALMIGPLVIQRWVSKTNLFYIFVFQGIFIIIWGFVQNNFYSGLVGIFFTGLLTTTLWSYTYALIQERVEHNYLGRVLAYNEMIFMLSNVFTTLFIGIMVSFIDLMWITIILGVLFILVGFYYRSQKIWI